jgi:hypothetical protein
LEGTPADARGQPQLLRHLPDRRHRFAEGPSRRKVERDRHGRKLALSADDQRHHGFGDPREDVQRHRPAAPAHFQLLQRLRPLLKFRHHLKNDAVLVQLREHGGDLPLAEGIVECIGDELRRDTHAGGGIAIDLHQRRQPLIQLIAADIPQLRPYLQALQQFRSPAIQFLRIGVFQRILKLGAADAIFHGEILHRLHVQGDPIHLRHA